MTSLEYIAGFFDGEGCVSLVRLRNSYELCVSIGQRLPCPLLEELKTRYGGSIFLKKETAKRALAGQWNISSRKAEAFLQELLPYLQGKRPITQRALEYRALVSHNYGLHTGLAGGNKMPEHVKDCMEAIYCQMKELNKKGPRS